MDLLFDRTGEGRVLKCLTIVDDATHEAVAIEAAERAICGLMLARMLDCLARSLQNLVGLQATGGQGRSNPPYASYRLTQPGCRTGIPRI